VGGADGHLPGGIVGVMAPALLDSGVYDATEVGHLLAVGRSASSGGPPRTARAGRPWWTRRSGGRSRSLT
jgi:hypothetical protein